jgi:peroxiredoxin
LEIDGHPLSPQILRKGRVLLIFLTTKCSACQRELKLLSRLEGKIAGKVLVYGISFEERDEITRFTRENDITTRVLLDKNSALMHQLKVKYFPTKFLIEDGTIVKTWFGTSPDEAELLKQLGF